MTISYEATQADHWALNRYVYTHDWFHGGLLLLYVLVMPAFALVLSVSGGLPWYVCCVFTLLTLLPWGAFVYALLRVSSWYRLRAWPKAFRSIKLTLDEDGLHVATPKSTNSVGWSAVTKVARDRYAIYLFLSPRLAYIAPVRVFASPADADAFAAYASNHVNGHA